MNMPNPQIPPPLPPQNRLWRPLIIMFGLCLLFTFLAARVESLYGQWSNFLLRLGIYDHDDYSRFFVLCLICTMIVVIAKALRRHRP